MSLISNNNECNEEDKEYKRSMYERQREIENLNEEKSKKKNKFSELKNYNSNSILSLDHSRSMNPKKRTVLENPSLRIILFLFGRHGRFFSFSFRFGASIDAFFKA